MASLDKKAALIGRLYNCDIVDLLEVLPLKIYMPLTPPLKHATLSPTKTQCLGGRDD